MDPSLPAPTHYLGIAGLGESAAELPLSDPKAGLFGYDRTVTFKDLKRGAARTIALAEGLDGGPWTAGGRATVRGLVVGQLPFVDEGGQFASNHSAGTNVAFADASVRVFTSSVSPHVVETLVTLAARGDVPAFDD
jgi:prepilin-type processing-associated H-X9-DG protein